MGLLCIIRRTWPDKCSYHMCPRTTQIVATVWKHATCFVHQTFLTPCSLHLAHLPVFFILYWACFLVRSKGVDLPPQETSIMFADHRLLHSCDHSSFYLYKTMCATCLLHLSFQSTCVHRTPPIPICVFMRSANKIYKTLG